MADSDTGPGESPGEGPEAPPIRGLETAQPRCPDCGVRGIEHIVSRESTERAKNRLPWFHVVFCEQCGHVYDVIAKHVFAVDAPRFTLPSDRS